MSQAETSLARVNPTMRWPGPSTMASSRSGKVLYHGGVSTAKLHRRLETLVEYLTRANRVPSGTVVLTGTGIIVPQEAALAPGDVVTIAVPEIGELTNTVSIVS